MSDYIKNVFGETTVLCAISVTSGSELTKSGCNWNSTQKHCISETVKTIFGFPFFYIIRYFIQVIFENLVKGLFLKSLCKHLGGGGGLGFNFSSKREKEMAWNFDQKI